MVPQWVIIAANPVDDLTALVANPAEYNLGTSFADDAAWRWL